MYVKAAVRETCLLNNYYNDVCTCKTHGKKVVDGSNYVGKLILVVNTVIPGIDFQI